MAVRIDERKFWEAVKVDLNRKAVAKGVAELGGKRIAEEYTCTVLVGLKVGPVRVVDVSPKPMLQLRNQIGGSVSLRKDDTVQTEL